MAAADLKLENEKVKKKKKKKEANQLAIPQIHNLQMVRYAIYGIDSLEFIFVA